MNTQSLIARAAFAAVVAAAFASTAASAQEVGVDTTPFQATTTRAEVRAEVLRARAAGLLPAGTEVDARVQPVLSAAPSMLTREQVRAEARATARSNRRADHAYGAA
jgi:hypothetical protein